MRSIERESPQNRGIDKEAVKLAHPQVGSISRRWLDGLDEWIAERDGQLGMILMVDPSSSELACSGTRKPLPGRAICHGSGWRPVVRLLDLVGERFAAWYMRTVYIPQFDGHIAVSRYTAAELDIGLRPVHIAPMGLNVRQFSRTLRSDPARRELFGDSVSNPRAVVLLYVGRLSAEKNLSMLLDMMAELSGDHHHSWHLWLIGEGPLRDWLAHEGERKAPGRVHLHGHVGCRHALARI